MTQPIDTAYVEIKAKGEDETAREIAKALDRIAAEVKKLTKVIEKEFVQAGHEMEHEVQQATKSIEKDLERQAHAAEKTGVSLALAMKEAAHSAAKSIDDMADEAVNDLERVSRQALQTAATVALAGHAGAGGGRDKPSIDFGRNRDLNGISGALRGLGDLAGTAMTAVKRLAGELGDSLQQGATKAGQALGSLVGILGSVLGPMFSFIAGLGMLGVALLLTPIIIPVVAALAQLAGLFALMPGAIGVLVASFAPLMIAFSGIGAAVQALASGDLEKIDKAMQNLAPNARKFAVELFKIKDRLKEIKFAVQQNFFKEFNGSLTKLVNNLLPVLTTGLGDVSGALGRLGAKLSDTFGSPTAIAAFRAIFDSAQTAIDKISGPLSDAFNSIFKAIKAAQPFIDRMFGGLADGLQKFADWLSKAVDDGRFQKWLEDAFTVAKQLWDLLKAVGGLIGAVFSPDSADEGKSIIESVTESVKKLTEYLKSEEGKKQLKDLAQAGKDFAKALVEVTGWVTKFYGVISDIKESPLGLLFPLNIIGRFKFFKGLWDDFWPKLKEFGQDVGGWFKDAGSAISDFFGDVGQWFSDAWNTVTEKGGQIVQWFQDLPGKIGDFMSQIPGKVQESITGTFDNATYAVGYGIGTIVRFFIDLPGRISTALTTFWTTVTTWFNNTRTAVVDTVTRMWNSVVDWFSKLPGRVSSAVSTIVDKVSKWFRDTRDSAVRTATNVVNDVVGWFQKLPGRAADAISKLPGRIRDILRGIVTDALNIGRDIMNGIADGIDRGVNSAINAAIRAAKNVLKGFWDALDINSPSKLMMREVGMPIMEGVSKGVDKGTPMVTDSINTAVNRSVADTSKNAGTVGAAVAGGGITIQNLTIPITGTLDLSNPAAARAAAMQIYQALQQLQKEYR